MTRIVDPDRLIAAYLDEGVTELPDRVYEVVRSDIDQTRQRVVIGPWRTPDMNSFTKWAIAAAAVVVVAIAGYNLLPGRGGVGGAGGPPPSPSASPSSSASSTPSSSVGADSSDTLPAGSLAPATYNMHDIDGTGVTISFTVPAGWRNDPVLTTGPSGPDLPDGLAIGFWTGAMQVYKEPCQWDGAEASPPTGPTAREFIDALAAQPQRNASTPVERRAASAGGPNQWEGWSVDLTVPTDDKLIGAPCDEGQFRSWGPEGTRYHQGPGQRDTVWAVDVGEDRIIVDFSSFPGTPEKSVAEARAILESMSFSH
jgi:hypothetical protein